MPYELNLSLRPHQHLHYTDIFLFAMLAICGIIDVDLSICIDMFISITYNAVHSFNFFLYLYSRAAYLFENINLFDLS